MYVEARIPTIGFVSVHEFRGPARVAGLDRSCTRSVACALTGHPLLAAGVVTCALSAEVLAFVAIAVERADGHADAWVS